MQDDVVLAGTLELVRVPMDVMAARPLPAAVLRELARAGVAWPADREDGPSFGSSI